MIGQITFRQPLPKRLHRQIKIGEIYILLLIIPAITPLNIGCVNSPKSKEVINNIENQKVDTGYSRKNLNPIGYDSLSIFLGSPKRKVDEVITLKWDKDNEPSSNLVKYYSPYQTISLYKIKGNLDLYFSFNKRDSTLQGFYASLVFDNYQREDIVPNIKSELLKKFSYVNSFSTEEIISGDDNVKIFNGFKVSVKLDRASYSPTFYYSIQSTATSTNITQ